MFGTWWSFLSSSNNIAGCLSPFITTYLAVNYGWRYSIYSAGLVSVVLGFVPIIIMTLCSDKNSNSTATENVNNFQKNKNDNPNLTVYDLMKNELLWLLFLCFMVVFCAKTTLFDWGQLFIRKECGLSLSHGSAFVSSVEIGGFLGRLSAGWLTDIFVKRTLQKKTKVNQVPSYQVRMSVALAFMLGSVISIHAFRTLLHSDSSVLWTMSLGFSSGMFLYGVIAICGIVASESAPSHLSGSSYAIVALGGNVGSTLSGLPICYFAAHYSWSKVLLLLQILIGMSWILTVLFRNQKATHHVSEKED